MSNEQTHAAAVKSRRPDGFGHWPAGKRRSAIDESTRRRVLSRLRKQLARGRSRRELADMLEISDRTLRRWIAEEDYPTPELAERVLALRNPSRRPRTP